jgi:hypothetical protein
MYPFMSMTLRMISEMDLGDMASSSIFHWANNDLLNSWNTASSSAGG